MTNRMDFAPASRPESKAARTTDLFRALIRFFAAPAGLVACGALILTGCISLNPRNSAKADVHQALNPYATVGVSNPQRIVLPINQLLTPAGRQVNLPGMRPQVLALSPDGRLLVTSGKSHDLVIVNPASGVVLQHVPFPSEKAHIPAPGAVSSHILQPDKHAQVSFTGLVFSPDGKRIYLSNVNGSIKVFGVGANGWVSGLYTIDLPPSGNADRKAAIPAGLAVSKDGKRLFVVLNLSNRLLELDAANGRPLRMFDVGTEPYDVVLVGHKAYVSNWGGRRPDANSVTGPAGHGTRVRVDSVRYIADEGSVSVIDLRSGQVTKEILTGLHASDLAVSPDGRYVAVANAGSDTISLMSTAEDQVVETFSVKWRPHDLYGASPNALSFAPSGKYLYVCNGTQNAVAVVAFHPGHMKLLGLIPTGWYPGAIVCDAARHTLEVANIKGTGSWKRYGPGEKVRYNSHQYYGTLSLIPLPSEKELRRETEIVLGDDQRFLAARNMLPPRADQPARAVPERTGEPSLIKHVVYIIKENRTYDQVLGDMKEGNGAARLCVFGERVTPNQHKMCRQFALLDNTYCSGILSADGHQWADTAFATDYMERSFAGFPRSYPDGMEDADVDAMAYAPSGFIWDNAIAHGVSLRDYGEFTTWVSGWADPHRKGEPGFLDYYNDFVHHTGQTRMGSRPSIESLRPYMDTNTVGWNLSIPDIFRAAQFIKELKGFEREGKMPRLCIICLPNDHTSGTGAGRPTPAAQVADNDLAFGQIVDAISHGPFWQQTCIFAIEDDPQAGWDHVDSYRTTAYVIGPYVRHHAVIHNDYNQVSILHTIELILGLPPMNELDASAVSMAACFTNQPDLTPYDVVSNNIPIDQMNPPAETISDPLKRHYAEVSAHLPLQEPDQCPEDLLNRILWVAQKGSKVPYPEWAIKLNPNTADVDD